MSKSVHALHPWAGELALAAGLFQRRNKPHPLHASKRVLTRCGKRLPPEEVCYPGDKRLVTCRRHRRHEFYGTAAQG
jgi:hypothetical protein